MADIDLWGCIDPAWAICLATGPSEDQVCVSVRLLQSSRGQGGHQEASGSKLVLPEAPVVSSVHPRHCISRRVIPPACLCVPELAQCQLIPGDKQVISLLTLACGVHPSWETQNHWGKEFNSGIFPGRRMFLPFLLFTFGLQELEGGCWLCRLVRLHPRG